MNMHVSQNSTNQGGQRHHSCHIWRANPILMQTSTIIWCMAYPTIILYLKLNLKTLIHSTVMPTFLSKVARTNMIELATYQLKTTTKHLKVVDKLKSLIYSKCRPSDHVHLWNRTLTSISHPSIHCPRAKPIQTTSHLFTL